MPTAELRDQIDKDQSEIDRIYRPRLVGSLARASMTVVLSPVV